MGTILSSLQAKIIAVLTLVIIAGFLYFQWYRSQQEGKIISATNELARLIPLQAISDSLRYKFARVGEDLRAEISNTSQLKKLLKQKNETILALSSISYETEIESVFVPTKKVGEVATFDTTDRWFELAGTVDSAGILFSKIATRDSLTLLITKSVNNLLYGYVENHSPYNKIVNADFALSIDAFVEKPSSIWKYLTFAEAILIVLILLRG